MSTTVTYNAEPIEAIVVTCEAHSEDTLSFKMFDPANCLALIKSVDGQAGIVLSRDDAAEVIKALKAAFSL